MRKKFMSSLALITTLCFFMCLFSGCGCNSRSKKSTAQHDTKDFKYAIMCDSHPIVGSLYKFDKSSIADCVKSTKEKGLYYIEGSSYISVTALIQSKHDYCDGESLREGMYKYIGNRFCEIEMPVEVGDDYKLVTKNVKCREFVEMMNASEKIDKKENSEKKIRHVKASYL